MAAMEPPRPPPPPLLHGGLHVLNAWDDAGTKEKAEEKESPDLKNAKLELHLRRCRQCISVAYLRKGECASTLRA